MLNILTVTGENHKRRICIFKATYLHIFCWMWPRLWMILLKVIFIALHSILNKRQNLNIIINLTLSVICFTPAIFCSRPPILSHLNLIIQPNKTVYSYNEVVNFSCSDGFTLTGKSYKRCQQTGDFNRYLPNCTGKEKQNVSRVLDFDIGIICMWTVSVIS